MIPSRNFYIDSDSRDNFALIMLLNEPLLFSLRASLIRVKSHQPKIITQFMQKYLKLEISHQLMANIINAARCSSQLYEFMGHSSPPLAHLSIFLQDYKILNTFLNGPKQQTLFCFYTNPARLCYTPQYVGFCFCSVYSFENWLQTPWISKWSQKVDFIKVCAFVRL